MATHINQQAGDNSNQFGEVHGDVHIHQWKRPETYLAPFQAPPLPQHFVLRPEVTNALKERLLNNEATTLGILVVSAIHGLGGIGKSTLAAALAYDKEVQERFPDGILWATLGQQPEILSLLSERIHAMRDYDFRPTTIEVASAHLRTLLQDKAVLVVVDDVWNPEHAIHFKVGGPRCQVLLTTRRMDVAEALHAEIYQVPEMTKSQSLALLANRMGVSIERIERENALRLVNIVGNLPLAMELAAARIARGVSWNTLCNALEQENARLRALGGPRRETALEASLNISVQSLRNHDDKAWEAFVWLGVLPESTNITASMMAPFWNMDEDEASETLDLLWNDALLIQSYWVADEEKEWPVYRLHNLLHHLARKLLTANPPEGLGLTLQQARVTLLGENGPFRQNSQLLKTEDGSGLFALLAKDAPEEALKCLQQTLGQWNNEQLSLTSTVQENFAEALEHIAGWGAFFPDAARLLLRLAEAGGDKHVKQAFVRLFCINEHPDFTHTETPPHKRFPILKEALESKSETQRLLSLDACNHALHTFNGGIVFEHEREQRKQRNFWAAESWEELFNTYRQVWQLLAGQIDTFPEAEQLKTVDILLERAQIFSGLGRYRELDGMVLKTVEQLSQKPYVEPKKILKAVIEMLDSDKGRLSEDTRQAWMHIKKKLTGSDFHAHMKRYVGMDVREYTKDEKGHYQDQVQPHIEALAQQAFERQELLHSKLNWLVTAQAENGYHFGYDLGKHDKTFSLLPIILDVQRHTESEPGVLFLSGYLKALFEHNSQQWEELMDSFTEDEVLHSWIPEITWRSSQISDRAGLRMLKSIQAGDTHIGHFRMLIWGGVVRNLSEDVFSQWIEYLLVHPDKHAISIALDLYRMYYAIEQPTRTCPEDLTLRLLIKASFSQASEETEYYPQFGANWEEIGEVFVQSYPSRSLELADLILEHFGGKSPIFHSLHSPSQIVLTEISRQSPQESWARIAKYLEIPRGSQFFALTYWLQNFLALFPMGLIWQWVEENIQERAPYLAKVIPSTFCREENKACWTREFLIRYGDRKDVRERLLTNFFTNFLSYGCSGSRTAYLQHRKQEMLDFKQKEENEHVRQWLDEYVSALEHEIERVSSEEERMEF